MARPRKKGLRRSFGAIRKLGRIDERGVAATTEELCRRLPRRHPAPAFGEQHVNAISPAMGRRWRAERRKATVPQRRRRPAGC
ncbi:hypothetical protein [Streptomyces badius]|uniref:Uncharacterized protein n=1 Tax=Streptomyces badius TaxID=1941 RepID=A0ABQ2T6S2_STRBA|nr:hypothetical protein [Streptomyces badius]GGS50117.1 hypothetical protein GCM10010253_25590 [Streptomyces badius]